MGRTAPVVFELVLIRQPFWLLETLESENVISVTTLLLFPPTEPILRPWPPIHVMPVTVTFTPLVTATQSSWLLTYVFDKMTLLLLEKSKPSELCAAARPPDAELAALPALLSRCRLSIVIPVQPVTSKQWTGQFWMLRLVIVPRTILERTMK